MQLPENAFLVQALQNPKLYDHPIEKFEVLETHISWVILTGPYAYKLKKSVNLGFADFSTLEKRQFYCEEELRLNRRLAPSMYLEVVAVTGSQPDLHLNGQDPPSDYLVKMKQFSQDALLDRVLRRGDLMVSHLDHLAVTIAKFHQQINVAKEESSFGLPQTIRQSVMNNFEAISPLPCRDQDKTRLEKIQAWTRTKHQEYFEYFQDRKQKGFVRECHGDLHLGNIALLNDEVTVFDCIEFNARLRWIDVMSEIGFFIMDLKSHGRSDLAFRFLNRYLEETGDYAGLTVLSFYETYRAMVRGKVAAIRWSQEQTDTNFSEQNLKTYRSYLTVAEEYTCLQKPSLLITHGLAGSGKSTVSQALVETLGGIRVRSDVERKRLFGCRAKESSSSSLNEGMYETGSTQATYQRLEKIAKMGIQAGYQVIVDATFLKRDDRVAMKALAQQLQVPFLILDITAPTDVLHQRVVERLRVGEDASEATIDVLDQQMSQAEPIDDTERSYAVTINTTENLNADSLKQQITNVLAN